MPIKEINTKPSSGAGGSIADLASRAKAVAGKAHRTALQEPLEGIQSSWADHSSAKAPLRASENPKVQFSVTGPQSNAEKLKALAARERRTYSEMIGVMADIYERLEEAAREQRIDPAELLEMMIANSHR